jgi:hypothetical protein
MWRNVRQVGQRQCGDKRAAFGNTPQPFVCDIKIVREAQRVEHGASQSNLMHRIVGNVVTHLQRYCTQIDTRG